MKMIFFGTPEYVVPILEALHKQYNRGPEKQLIGVVTQSPKPTGRDKTVTYSAVDHFAHKHNIPIYFDLEELPEVDLGVCAAYGKIIPDHVLHRFSQGLLNIHPSLLPLWRGTGPTQAAIMAGAAETGVTVIKTDAEMDHGAIVSRFMSPIETAETGESLRERLFIETIPFLMELIPNYMKGKIHLKEQDHEKATYTKMLTKQDGQIPGKYLEVALTGEELTDDWQIPFMKNFIVKPSAVTVDRYIRALSPWPGTWVSIHPTGEQETKRLKILKSNLTDGVLVIESVQMEGKNVVSWEQFKSGYPNFTFA